MPDATPPSRARARKRVTQSSSWREYERRKAELLRLHAYPTPEQYERFIFELGKKLGL